MLKTGRKPRCTCLECAVCERRLKRQMKQADLGRLVMHENFSSSLNLFNSYSFYLGHPPPKCGRVAPKSVI